MESHASQFDKSWRSRMKRQKMLEKQLNVALIPVMYELHYLAHTEVNWIELDVI